jgi:hypothetical protein
LSRGRSDAALAVYAAFGAAAVPLRRLQDSFGLFDKRTMRRIRWLSVLLCVCATVSTAYAQEPQDAASWSVYQDEATGISFRYPADWQVGMLPCPPGGLWGCLSSVLLGPAGSSRDPLPYPALKMDVHTCDGSPTGLGLPCSTESMLNKCLGFERFQVGDSQGLQCIEVFSGTCSWSAVVPLDGREIKIGAPYFDYQANEHARTPEECVERVIANRKTSPLREILASFAIPLPKAQVSR